MKNKIVISVLSMIVLLCGCGNTADIERFDEFELAPVTENFSEAEASTQTAVTIKGETEMNTEILTTQEVTETQIHTEIVEEQKPESEKYLAITVNGQTFSAEFCENESTQAFVQMLPVTIDMSDYSGFEKVGSLGQTLPSDDVQMTTQVGDIVLYNSNQIVVFYGSNSWSYTKLATIHDLTGWEEALGSNDIQITFSIGE